MTLANLLELLGSLTLIYLMFTGMWYTLSTMLIKRLEPEAKQVWDSLWRMFGGKKVSDKKAGVRSQEG